MRSDIENEVIIVEPFQMHRLTVFTRLGYAICTAVHDLLAKDTSEKHIFHTS